MLYKSLSIPIQILKIVGYSSIVFFVSCILFIMFINLIYFFHSTQRH